MPYQQTAIQAFLHLHPGSGVAGPLHTGKSCNDRPWYCTVLSLATRRNSLIHSTPPRSSSESIGRYADSGWSAGTPKRWLNRGRKSLNTWFASSKVLAPARRNSETSRSLRQAQGRLWKVPLARSTRPLASGLWANIWVTPSSPRARAHWNLALL